MYMYLYNRAFMDHTCILGAALFHQAPPCLLYTQPRAEICLDPSGIRTNDITLESRRSVEEKQMVYIPVPHVIGSNMHNMRRAHAESTHNTLRDR